MWDTQTGQELLSFKDVGRTAAFRWDGKRLATPAGGNTIKVWDVATGQELLTLKGHIDWVSGVAFSPDGHRLAAGTAGGTVTIWDATPLPEKSGP